MTREDWLRVKSVSAGALEQSEADRRAYVAAACAGDDALAHEVWSLVASVEKAAPLYETVTFAAPGSALVVAAAARLPALGAGDRVGPYRILKELGRGGMGVVFLADRADDEYRQRVALKVVDAGGSPWAMKSFRDERQILATLDHPNIARLMDGGTTVDGLPYFVMEYVEGEPVDEYCDARSFGVTQRLRVFRQICGAVDFAHRNLVVHRDLKPRNILVAGDIPKLLDFGIAKLLAPAHELALGAGIDTGPGMLTPEYASPEQLQSGPITTSTDVYALGVLLYRLLTGTSPYRTASRAPHDIARAICEDEPDRPSAAAATRTLRRQLAGDLDTIVLTALKKAPADRYASAASLAEDIDRHLASRPLVARPDSLRYRTGRFFLRHKLGASAAALVVAAIAAGLGATVWQARQTELQRAKAQRRFDDVRRVASSLIFEMHDSIENVPGALKTRQLLVKRGLEYFDGLAADEHDNPGLQRELAEAYDRMGNVLGRPYSANLGETSAALASYEKAMEIRRRLAASSLADRRSQLDLWSSYYNIGGLRRETSDTLGALKLHEQARQVVERLLQTAPDDVALLRSAAQTASTLSVSYAQNGRIRDGLNAAQAALAFDERLLVQQPGNLGVQHDMASVHGRVGLFFLKLGDGGAARPHFQRGFELAQALISAEPANVTFVRRLSNGHSHFALLFARHGDLDAAWTHQQQALAIRQRLVDENPKDRQAAIDLMVSEIETGDVRARRREFAAAADQYRIAVAKAEPLVAADPRYVYYRLSLASALTRLAQALVATGRAAEAQPRVARALTLAGDASAADPADARLQFELALAQATMGDVVAKVNAGTSGAGAHTWYERARAAMTVLRDTGRLAGGTQNGDEPATLAEIERKIAATRKTLE